MYTPLNMIKEAEKIEGKPVWVEIFSDGSGFVVTRDEDNEDKVLIEFLPLEMRGYTDKPVGVGEGLSCLYHENRGLKWERNE